MSQGATSKGEPSKDTPSQEVQPEDKKPEIGLMDKIGRTILRALAPEAAEELFKLHEAGIFEFNDSKIPAHYKFDPQDKSLQNIIRGMIKAQAGDSDGSNLENITELELKGLIDGLHQPHNATVPDNYILPPRTFGGKEMSSDDIQLFRDYRKDTREQAPIEDCLQFIKEFHEEVLRILNKQC